MFKRFDTFGNPHVAILAVGILTLVTHTACGGTAGGRPVGSGCDEPSQCASGLCVQSTCVDPEGDADNDGVPNRIEVDLGSNPAAADTDGDGIADRAELGESFAMIDTDSDGISDILESAILDADSDCITNQYDARDAVADNDLSPMLPKVCRREGVCAAGAEGLSVMCPDGRNAECSYTGVAGFADPEVACDGRDENCDGRVDEAFADEAGVVDCGGPTPYVGHATGGGIVLESDRFRARVTVGPAVIGPASSNRYRATIGAYPKNMQVPSSGGQ